MYSARCPACCGEGFFLASQSKCNYCDGTGFVGETDNDESYKNLLQHLKNLEDAARSARVTFAAYEIEVARLQSELDSYKRLADTLRERAHYFAAEVDRLRGKSGALVNAKSL